VRLHIFSDVHAEFGNYQPTVTDADVVVIAGDLHLGRQGIDLIRSNYTDKPVVYVLGNHEFYRHALPKLTEDLERESIGSNVHVLENRAVSIGDVRFLGCTLWSDFKIGGDAAAAKLAAEEIISDYRLIRVSPEFRKLRARDTALLHARSLAWLKQELSSGDTSRTVVVTHHAPSVRSVPPIYTGDLLNGAFASNLESMIIASEVPLWIHGHTHHCVDYQLGATRVFSNQRGYPDAIAPEFIPNLIVDI
jgi:Icc-related predicted phosphoesterase